MMEIINNNRSLESVSDIASSYKINSFDDGDSSVRVSEFVSTYTKKVVEKNYFTTTSIDANQLIQMNTQYLNHVNNDCLNIGYNGQKLLE